MNPIYQARKKRQLRYLVKRLKGLLKESRSTAVQKIDSLVKKIKALVKELSRVLAPFHLKKILGPAAVILGISFSAHVAAQDISFAEPQMNPFGLDSTYYIAIPAFADLDGDGDMDLLVGEDYGAMQYFENTGSASNPQFAAPQENPFGLVSTYEYAFPAFADLDGDGDMDLLVGEYYGAMQYFENTGSASNPQFAAPQENPFGLDSTYVLALPAFADLDGDGDMDLLVGEYYGNMQYFENTGSASNPQFAAPQQNPFGLVSTNYWAFPAFADLDNDGDMDLLAGEYLGSMQYFENTSPVGVHEQYADIPLDLYPNPVSNILTIDTDTPFEEVEVYDALGRLLSVYNGSLNSINVSAWSNGMYLLKFIDEQGLFTTRKILKE